MQVCKSLHKHLNTNKIWWLLYNRAFTTIRTLDQASWFTAPDSSCPAREAFFSMKKAAAGGYKVDPSNVYRAWLFGRIGPLPKTETLARQFGDKYDLLASFSAKFVTEGKPCQISNISLPTLDRIGLSEAVVIMVNPADPEPARQIVTMAIKYIEERKAKNTMMLINGSQEQEKLYEKCPELKKLEAMVGHEKTYVVEAFTEESLAKVAHMMISLARAVKGL